MSPCLFNLHAKYLMQNARLDEAQAGIKIARRNINNLRINNLRNIRYADNTTLIAEREVKGSEVKVTQLCLTLCDPIDYIVHGILQARILEWVAIPFSGDLPSPGMEPRSPALQAESSPAEPPGMPSKEQVSFIFRAAVTICNDFGGQKKSSLFRFPIYLL